MSLAGLAFIFHFIPAFLPVYYIVPIKKRGIVLLIGSLIFYSFGSPIHLLFLISIVLINYFFANRIYKRGQTVYSDSEPDFNLELDLDSESDLSSKLDLSSDADLKESLEKNRSICLQRVWLIVAVIFDLGVLFILKYMPALRNLISEYFGDNVFRFTVTSYFGDSPALSGLKAYFGDYGFGIPLGISFVTFQMLSFLIDMYRGRYKEGVSLYHFAIYSTMFPQIASGPITRYSEIQDALERPNYVNPKFLEEGITYFTIGLSYKILLADKIASLWNDVLKVGASGIDTASAWLGAWGYSFEIYFDFFGYSLMAIGIALLLGIRLPDNFTEPYSSKTMTAFWRNWHITLGRWFKDYLYIPLGGNRHSKIRTAFNIFVVWMLTSIWHGATINFVFWGLFLFIIIFIEKNWTGKWLENTKILGHIYMLIIIPISWIIFNITNPWLLKEYLMRMFGIAVEDMAVNGLNKFYSLCDMYWWLFIICIVFASPYPLKFIKKHSRNYLLKILLFVVFWYSIYELAVSGNNPFIYFGF